MRNMCDVSEINAGFDVRYVRFNSSGVDHHSFVPLATFMKFLSRIQNNGPYF